jgi:hypothetical protein
LTNGKRLNWRLVRGKSEQLDLDTYDRI